jgi:hypothetical protein
LCKRVHLKEYQRKSSGGFCGGLKFLQFSNLLIIKSIKE